MAAALTGSNAWAESLCSGDSHDGPEPGAFFAAFNTTAEGASDGTVGIAMPEQANAHELEYVVHATVHFDEFDYTWDDGPYTAEPGEMVDWWAEVPAASIMTRQQYDDLSDLLVTVELYADGDPVGRQNAGWARVAFEEGEDPLVMLPDEAEELAPDGTWNPNADARRGSVSKADLDLPSEPADPDNHGWLPEVDG